jgi:hypothetical protein
MDNLVRLFPSTEAAQHTGRVVSVSASADRVEVDVGGRAWEAARAVSCLEAPREGDLVLLTTLAEGGCFVLAVLAREAPGHRLAFEGDVEFAVRDGALRVFAKEGVEVLTAGRLGATADEVDVSARRAGVAVQAVTFVGHTVETEVKRARHVAAQVDRVAERVVERAGSMFRYVSGLDHLRADAADWVVAKLLNVHAKTAMVTADELVKVDGEQIHMG